MRIDASCLCGGVRFTIPGPVGDITACHCSQCRRTSGHHSASFDVDGDIDYQWRETLAEYKTPNGATRGFCNRCGSSIWYRYVDGGLSVEAGAVDGLTNARLSAHIFTADKGDYYTLADGQPQSKGYP